MASFYCLETEKAIIVCLLKNPEVYVELSFLNTKDFSKTNSPIFSVISQIIETKGTPDPIIVINNLNSLGITISGIEIADYINNLMLLNVEPKNVVALAKELKKKTLIRTLVENTDKLKHEVVASENKSGKDILGLVDKYLGDSLFSLTGDNPEPVNVLETLPDIIEEFGNEQNTSTDIIMPYKSFRENLGNLKCQNLYVIMARSGGSKSTFLLDMMRQISDYNMDKDLSILYLDTEMRPEDAMIRYIAGAIGVPYWLIDSRQWRKDSVWCPKIRAELDRIRKKKTKKLYFEQIGNKSGIELEKYVKRFYLNKVGRGNPFFVLYDYLKISEADKADSKGQQEYIVAYTKTEILKELAEYCNCPIFTAIQENRSGITTGKSAHQIDDSEGSASMSDRLNWLVAFMGKLRKRTHDEMLEDSMPDRKAPTHKLIATKTRYLGRHGPQFLDYVKVKIGNQVMYRQNFINLNIDNFAVEDMGTYSEMLERIGKTKINLQNDQGQKSNDLI